MSQNMKLASRWPIVKVRRCLRNRDRNGLVRFIKERHEERFFQPIRHLINLPENPQGYGFATMALCALLVETIQSYEDGLPTTHSQELKRLRTLHRIPAAYRLPPSLQVNGKKTFQRFFLQHRQHFSGVSGTRFYKNIRNGLLHQGQTRAGWTLRKASSDICDPGRRIIYRDNFMEALEASFNEYLGKLRAREWDSRLWRCAARKIWWLIRLSV